MTARASVAERLRSPPATRAGLLGQRGDPVEQLQAAVLAEVLGNAEYDVGLSRLGAHRRQVGERRGQRLARRSARGSVLAAKVDSVDEGVDGGRGGPAGHGDRGVVTGAEPDSRPGGRKPLPHPRQQLELAHRSRSPGDSLLARH